MTAWPITTNFPLILPFNIFHEIYFKNCFQSLERIDVSIVIKIEPFYGQLRTHCIYKIVIIGIRNIWKVGNGILSGETKTKARARILWMNRVRANWPISKAPARTVAKTWSNTRTFLNYSANARDTRPQPWLLPNRDVPARRAFTRRRSRPSHHRSTPPARIPSFHFLRSVFPLLALYSSISKRFAWKFFLPRHDFFCEGFWYSGLLFEKRDSNSLDYLKISTNEI